MEHFSSRYPRLAHVQNITPTNERDVFWHWAKAEFTSLRFSEGYVNLTPRVQTLLRSGQKENLTASDWENLQSITLWYRRPLLVGLRRLGTNWFTDVLRYDELPNVLTMTLPDFVAAAPSRRLSDFAAALDRGEIDPAQNELIRSYKQTRDTFSLERLTAAPILVAESKDGPYVLLEGYSRLSAMTSLHLREDLTNGAIDVLLGVCNNLREWYLSDNRRECRLHI